VIAVDRELHLLTVEMRGRGVAESERTDVSKVFESAQPSASLASVKLRVAYAVAHPPPSPVREDSAGEQQALRAQVCAAQTLHSACPPLPASRSRPV